MEFYRVKWDFKYCICNIQDTGPQKMTFSYSIFLVKLETVEIFQNYKLNTSEYVFSILNFGEMYWSQNCKFFAELTA